jgi:glycosyltransferase involved in cell wall biosynthesis
MSRLRRQIEIAEERSGKRLRDAAPIRFLFDVFADAAMPSLYAAATHYISMSFGEGWDQTMMEAAAMGLKLIAPDHSSYREYLDPSIATLVPSREVPAVYGKSYAGEELWQAYRIALYAGACVARSISGASLV